MKIFWLLIIISMFVKGVKGQKLPLKAVTERIKQGLNTTAEDFGFKEYKVLQNNDTVTFYTYQRAGAKPSSIYMFLPGTNAENIYSYHKDADGSYWYNSLTSFDFSYLTENYLFVIAAKPGFGFLGNGDKIVIPPKYWRKTSLQDRTMRANVALTYIKKNIVKNPKHTVVFGYSEGFYVAAKLATVNKSITHLGIGGGGGYTDFYDFILLNQKLALKDDMVLDSAIKSNNEIISTLRQVMSAPNSTKSKYGYTYKRWASFAEPSIQSLVKLTIPIYQVHGTNDESTPIESAYVVPIEFARLRKSNLTFNVYSNSNHSLIEQLKDKREINHWDEMMIDFFKWITVHSK